MLLKTLSDGDHHQGTLIILVIGMHPCAYVFVTTTQMFKHKVCRVKDELLPMGLDITAAHLFVMSETNKNAKTPFEHPNAKNQSKDSAIVRQVLYQHQPMCAPQPPRTTATATKHLLPVG